MRRFYNFSKFEPQAFDEINYDTFPIFELQEAYAIIGEEKTYDEVGELHCVSMG